MTCQEFARLNSGGLGNMTAGERAVCAVHYSQCAGCRQWVKDQDAANEKKLREQEATDADMAFLTAVSKLQSRKDLTDPEVRAILAEGLQKREGGSQ